MKQPWQNLEHRVADYFRRNGYTARTNQKIRGRSGLTHEIDVVAERSDAAGVHRVAIECKHWQSAIEKDVVYKLAQVVSDVAFSKGIVVTSGGARAGARTAAEQSNIEVWTQNEIARLLGREALAGAPLSRPDTGLAINPAISVDVANREIKRARSGLAGFGRDEVTSVDLVWIPSFEMQLAITHVRAGVVVKDREEVIRSWNLYEALTGRRIGERAAPREAEVRALEGSVLQGLLTISNIESELRKVLKKHARAVAPAAQVKRKVAYNTIGLPGSASEFVVESAREIYVPYYVGKLAQKGAERFVAVHAGVGVRDSDVEHALHARLDVLTRALDSASSSAEAVDNADASRPHDGDSTQDTRPCVCGCDMIVRRRKSDGAPFWGCSTFPRCRHTEKMK